MKKILFVILLFISFNVNAKEISFEEVANDYIKKYDWDVIKDSNEYKLYKDFEDNITSSYKDNKIIVSYQIDTKKHEIIFTNKDNIISYHNTNDFDNSDFFWMQDLVDSLAISKMIYIVGELKGYTTEDLMNNATKIEHNEVTFANNGLELKWNTRTSNDSEIEYIEEFNIDIRNFNLEGKKEIITYSNKEDNKEEKLDIPNNILLASIIFGVLIILIIILSSYLLISHKKCKSN